MLLEPPTYAVARRIKDALYELELVEAGLPLCLPISAVRINLGLGFVFFLGGGWERFSFCLRKHSTTLIIPDRAVGFSALSRVPLILR